MLQENKVNIIFYTQW